MAAPLLAQKRRHGDRLLRRRLKTLLPGRRHLNDTYELYAIKYGSVMNRPMSENFIGGDPHDMSKHLDYFVWVATNSERTFLIDTGFNYEVAKQRGRQVDRLPREGLELLGIDAFDQPGVEMGKLIAFALMGRDGYADALDGMDAFSADAADEVWSA